MRLAPLLLPLALALLPACVVTRHSLPMGDGSTVLAGTQLESDAEVTWVLYPSPREGEPKLGRTTKRTSEVAFAGLTVRSIDAKLAETLGVEPWRGVQVTSVVADSAAERAGVRVGDIVLSIAGTALTNDVQFTELVQTSTTPREPTPFSVLRDAAIGSEGSLLELTVVPTARTVTETLTDSFKLATEPELLERTGLQLATLPPEYAEPIYAQPSSVAVVSGVVVGSPAYEAGLRGGDRVLRCNGLTVTSAGEVAELLRRPPAPAGDGTSSKSSTHRLDLEVVGPLGPHQADVEVTSGIYGTSTVYIPIVYDSSKSVDHTRWSLLDFIFQFGANYTAHDLRSATREPLKESDLSILPFGMFEFERGPKGSSTTLFWWIRFKSS
jgi:membrane-associated protease RseP (regulator of RpoE activity)